MRVDTKFAVTALAALLWLPTLGCEPQGPVEGGVEEGIEEQETVVEEDEGIGGAVPGE